jgi:hypothetical protein
MAEGVLWYFPAALAEIARVSKAGNDQHNPGQPMHHARGKSTDHADCILRHLADAGLFDSDGLRHTAKAAWRALALLQEELEREEDAPMPRNARIEEFHVEHAATDSSGFNAAVDPDVAELMPDHAPSTAYVGD